MVDATFTDTVPPSTDHMYFKNIHTYISGKQTAGDHRDEHRQILARFIYNNWTCSIPLSQIGYDQYFTGYGDIVIKFKEEDATIVGGMTGHTDFIESSQFLGEIPYRIRVDIFIEVRANIDGPMPEEMNTLKVYIKDFIRRRPLGLLDEGYTALELTSGFYNYPEQRDKNTFKDSISVIMKEARTYH